MQSPYPCPRCQTWAIENLRTHTFCWECNFTTDEDQQLQLWHQLEYKKPVCAHPTPEEKDFSVHPGAAK